MKKTLAIFLTFALLVSALTGCSTDKIPVGGTDGQTESTDYDYQLRDLPEAKYITPASAFAGGTGTESDPYQISNAAELALLHAKMEEDETNNKYAFQSAHYILTDDIALNDTADFKNWETAAPAYSWQPIGGGLHRDFDGVFDGNGHVISGLYVNTNCESTTENCYGLFDVVDGVVRNVKIEQSYFAVSGSLCLVGSIAGSLTDEAVVENCSSNAVFQSYDTTCGGIVGGASGGVDTGIVDEGEERETLYARITKCSFSGAITQVKEDASAILGGIVGGNSGNVDSCVHSGTINFAGGNVDCAGGIAGRMGEGTVSNCKNEGTLHCETTDGEDLAIAGGIVGKIFVSASGSAKYMSRGAKIVACENSGAVEGQMYAGGIAGQFTNDYNDYCSTISKCINNGTVTSPKYTGGIVGYMNCIGDNDEGESLAIEDCENKADLSKGITVGGIVGQFMSETGDVKIKGCTNSGNLTSEGQHCAGIIAYWIMDSKPSESHIVVGDCKNTGSISSGLNAGGIISFMDMPVCLEMGKGVEISIENCTNSGNVTTDSVNGYIGGVLGNWGMKDISTTLKNCSNVGALSITAVADGMTVEDAEKMTVSRIAGGIVGRVGSGLLLTTDHDKVKEQNIQAAKAVLKIQNCKQSGSLTVNNAEAEGYKNWFGGIIGNTCGEDGFSVLVENCTYTGFGRGLGNEISKDLGTKNA